MSYMQIFNTCKNNGKSSDNQVSNLDVDFRDGIAFKNLVKALAINDVELEYPSPQGYHERVKNVYRLFSELYEYIGYDVESEEIDQILLSHAEDVGMYATYFFN